MDKIQSFRQPLFTATGILLGFILNFASIWVANAFLDHIPFDIIIGITLMLCFILLLIVLYRILSMHYSKDRAEEYYKKTLHLFIIGVSLPFLTILIIIIERMLPKVHKQQVVVNLRNKGIWKVAHPFVPGTKWKKNS